MHFDGTHSHRTNKLGKSEIVSLHPKQAQKSPAERFERNRAAALKRRDAPEQKLPIGIEANGIIAPWIDKSFGVAQYQTGLLAVIQDRDLPDMGVVSSDLG